MQKSCGNCAYWTRMKQQFKGKSFGGLCELYDLGWCQSDHGKDCHGWRPLKYVRRKGDQGMTVRGEV